MGILIVNALFIIASISVNVHCQTSIPKDITIHRDGINLRGKIYLADSKGILPTVILLHGFPGNEYDVLCIGEKLSETGINVLTFNYSGTHQSDGDFNFQNTQKDIQAAFEFVFQPGNIQKFKIDTTRIILGGYSYGGGMALTFTANHSKIESVFSIGGNDHGAFMREYSRNPEMKEVIDRIFDELKAQPEVVRFGRGAIPAEITELRIIETNPTLDLRYCASLLAPKNIFLIGGWDDQNVSFEKIILPLYRALVDAKASNVKITGVQDDHSFRNSREEVAQLIIDWLEFLDKGE